MTFRGRPCILVGKMEYKGEAIYRGNISVMLPGNECLMDLMYRSIPKPPTPRAFDFF